MGKKFYLIIATVSIVLSSCLKQSIPDAMLEESGRSVTATMSYEINGHKVNITVKDADHQVAGSRTLACEKANGFVLWGVGGESELAFTFYTDSLRLGNYKYTSYFGPMYFARYEGTSHYVYGALDNMNFNITKSSDGHISGNFSGLLTPEISTGNGSFTYGVQGSVAIKNGSFTNIPVIY